MQRKVRRRRRRQVSNRGALFGVTTGAELKVLPGGKNKCQGQVFP